ncbi:MAG TPA: hypothetical protein VG320_21870 [Paraburkholderia sp.]|nr:hypothetical protein [Paraburkholderia sp.]
MIYANHKIIQQHPVIDDLLDFAEQIGFLLSRRAIDIDAVYEFFET